MMHIFEKNYPQINRPCVPIMERIGRQTTNQKNCQTVITIIQKEQMNNLC